MANTYFKFKQFTVHQERSAMKVTTDSCLFGAWVSELARSPGSKTLKVLDIGTGTGLLTLMFAQNHPGAMIDAIEIDKESFEQASENIASSPWATQINTFHADVKEFGFSHKYNMILSNPPFYDQELKGDDARKNIAHHDEGLTLPELLNIIKDKLEPAGSFYILLPYKRYEEFRRMLSGHDLALRQITLVRQSTSHDYFRMMVAGGSGSTGAGEIKVDEIAIKDEKGNYTPAFNYLLIDYYLQL